MKYFTLWELTRSTTANARDINNTPSATINKKLVALIENCLDPIRAKWGKPIGVNSGYRCRELNYAVGGATNSQHLRGEAADISAGSRDANKELFHMIVSDPSLHFDQIIDEADFKWIHISYKEESNRRKITHLKPKL